MMYPFYNCMGDDDTVTLVNPHKKDLSSNISLSVLFSCLIFRRLNRSCPIDDDAKDGGPGEVWISCSFYHEPLRTWIKTNVNKFAIWSRTAFKLDKQALRSYLKLTCEYELHILPNTKVSDAKDHGKSYMKVRPPLVCHL